MHMRAPILVLPAPHHTRTTCPLCPGSSPTCAPFHAPLCSLCTPSAHLCTPFVHLPCTFRAPMCTLCSIFQVCHPYPTFFLTSDPLPATMGNPALVQPGIVPTSRPLYNQVQPLWPPCSPPTFPVALTTPHSHSRTSPGPPQTHP